MARGDLVQSASSEIVGDDDVCDGVENELYVVRVRRTSHVTVDLFGGRFVFGLELCLDVRGGFSILLGPCTKRKKNSNELYGNVPFKRK